MILTDHLGRLIEFDQDIEKIYAVMASNIGHPQDVRLN